MSCPSVRNLLGPLIAAMKARLELKKQVEAASGVPDEVMLDAPPKSSCRECARTLTASSNREE
jgi:hypothetical protein